MSNSDSTVSTEEELRLALQAAADAKQPGESVRVGAAMDENALRSLLHAVGLHRVRRFTPDDPAGHDVYLEAFKPAVTPTHGVIAVMSLPRYGLTSNFGAVTRALTPLRIPLQQGFGVYWSEVMTGLFAKLAAEDWRYILTIDYDSVFDSADVLELVRLMDATPDTGAICGAQMRRTKPTPLLTMPDGATSVPADLFERELTRLRTAHFGLTLIRTESLRKLSRPWFQATPDREGEWRPEHGYVSADVGFWHKFHDEGHALYQANTVAVGHVEEMIVWPGRTLAPVLQNMDDYRTSGIPDEALR